MENSGGMTRKSRNSTCFDRNMTELGHSRQFDDVRVTSAFPPITAVKRTSQHFAFVNAFVFQVNVFVPFGDFCFCQILLQKALPLNPPGARCGA
jgi:hypothetical protein